MTGSDFGELVALLLAMLAAWALQQTLHEIICTLLGWRDKAANRFSYRLEIRIRRIPTQDGTQ